ncbi:hypothetical protein BsWGS_21033 [Bradybaena similaris]
MMGGPTLDDVTKAICSVDKPYKCLPYGNCYDHNSYCSPESGTVEPCFPHRLLTNDSKFSYCQSVSQNVTQLLHPSCHSACKIIELEHSISVKSVSETGCSGDQIWPITVAFIIILAVVLVERFTLNAKWRKKMCKKVTVLCQKTRKDDYVLAVECPREEEPALGVQIRDGDDRVLHSHADMDVSEVTQPETQIQNPPQQNSTQQHLLETANGNPQLQPLTVNNTVNQEIPPSYDSLLNGSNISSPTLSSSSSSVSTSNDSGVNSGREGRIDHENLAQQSSQTCVMTNQIHGFNQQAQGERRADVSFHTNTSSPDEESSLVTNLTKYNRD